MKPNNQDSQSFTEEDKQQFKDEGLIEVAPGFWGLVGEHVESDAKDYERIGEGYGYWIVGN